MEASVYLRLAYRQWRWLLAATVLGAAAAWGASSLMAPTYQSTATLLVMFQQQPGVIERGDLETSTVLADTFVPFITIRPVLQQAIDKGGFALSVSQLRERLDIRHARTTQIITISATANNPELARNIANTVANVFIQSDEPKAAPRSGIVSMVDPATSPTSPISPRRSINTIVGALLGLIACSVALTLRDFRDDAVRSPQDVEAARLPAIATLQDVGDSSTIMDKLHVAFYPYSDASEEYRIARSRLVAALGQDESGALQHKVVLITSAVADAGRSATIANLAVTFGAAGYRVLLVDANLRDPALHTFFSLPNGPGLSTHLLGDTVPVVRHIDIGHAGEALKDAQRRSAAVIRAMATSSAAGGPTTPYSTLTLISAGPTPGSPAEILGSRTMRSTLRALRAEYDLILLDCAPGLERADASELATMVDAIVIVARMERTRVRDLRRLSQRLAGPGRTIAGVLLTDAPRTGRLDATEPESDALAHVIWDIRTVPEE